jgi:hypothetical protein
MAISRQRSGCWKTAEASATPWPATAPSIATVESKSARTPQKVPEADNFLRAMQGNN